MTHEARTHLLIVDDLPENLLALEALIRRDDCVVHSARSGEQALSLLLEHDFALAILDVQMPGMDGFELAELMRGTERTRHIPLVFVTAAGHEIDHAFKGYENGAVDFLYKPLDSFAVRGKVDVFVDLHRQREQTRRQLAALEQSRLEQQALQAELERALRMRDDFMSLVAHELRTPLSVLALGLQVRQKQLEKGNAEFFAAPQLAAMLTKDLRQVHSMTRLIEDMLDVSRIRNGKLSIRPAQTDLSALLQRLVDDFAVHDKGRSISLAAEPGIVGWWDEFRIEQVVVNLLTNALRYGASRPIEVRLGASAGDACLVVRDHGIGIAPEAQQRIFEQFVRVADRSVPSGLGLGLFITRQLVEAHGGTIGVESRPGDGAAFTVRLPLAGRRVEPVLTPGPNAEGSIATSGTP